MPLKELSYGSFKEKKCSLRDFVCVGQTDRFSSDTVGRTCSVSKKIVGIVVECVVCITFDICG